ncbi:MAG: hypothetical protein MR585_09890, partial [Selenomonas bovis]|nr:hypothetical protein [Selenomonas bovis]
HVDSHKTQSYTSCSPSYSCFDDSMNAIERQGIQRFIGDREDGCGHEVSGDVKIVGYAVASVSIVYARSSFSGARRVL